MTDSELASQNNIFITKYQIKSYFNLDLVRNKDIIEYYGRVSKTNQVKRTQLDYLARRIADKLN